jgi:hypothetical protein
MSQWKPITTEKEFHELVRVGSVLTSAINPHSPAKVTAIGETRFLYRCPAGQERVALLIEPKAKWGVT